MMNHSSEEVDIHARKDDAREDVKETLKIIDVREIAAQQRHPFIFQTFDELPVGAAFILVNDHDPIPLYYQFMDRRKQQFRWEYVEEGPDLWRVRITKIN